MDTYDVPPAPVHISNSTNLLQPLEQAHRHTLYTLETLVRRRHRFATITVLTKNPSALPDERYVRARHQLSEFLPDHLRADWFAENRHRPLRVECSPAFYDDKSRKLLDPGAPSVESRTRAIRFLRKEHIPVFVRIGPLFPRDPLPGGKKMSDFDLPDVQPTAKAGFPAPPSQFGVLLYSRESPAGNSEPTMKCPFCQSDNDRVIDSRASEDGYAIRRRRQCLDCKRRYTTYERIEGTSVKIVKKDEVREPFDRAKIKRGLEKACWKRPVGDAQLEAIIVAVENDLEANFDAEVESRHVGELVMQHLRELDQVAYVRFASVYREFKDVHDFVTELRPMLDESRQ